MNARAAAGGGDPAAVARAQILDWARGQKTRPRLVVGFSGGLDSSVLLRALAPLSDRFFLLARHIHHGQRREADDWAEFCARQCARLGIDCEILRVAPGRAVGEEKLRQARYAALAQPAGGRAPDAIAVAHHLDDQAETTLFRLFRGGGARGWAAMRSVAPTPGAPTVALLRPFLEIEKSDLRACALARGIDFVEDEDNRNLARARNALRAEVLPAARARFPAVLRRLADFNRDCADIETILRAQAAADERRARRFGDGETAFWRQAGAARLRNYLFFALTARGVFAARGEICETARRVLAGGRGEEIFFARDGLELRADGRALSWLRALPRPPALAFDGRELERAGRLELPQTAALGARTARGWSEVARGDGDFAPTRGGGNNRFAKSARTVARGEDSALATRAFPAAGGGRTNRRRAGDRGRARLPRDGASDGPQSRCDSFSATNLRAARALRIARRRYFGQYSRFEFFLRDGNAAGQTFGRAPKW